MIRLPRFSYVAPTTIAAAAARLAAAASKPGGARLVAGGTDLVPNMKRRQQVPATVIGLRGVAALRARHVNGSITLGSMTSLASIVRDADLRAKCAGLVQAAAQVATPHLRNMATIGGNLCLDTRCTYYDQSYEWRQAINFCMKKDGDTCWVATSSQKCLAVSSTDTAPMLQALGARVRLVSASGEREIAVADLFNNDGMHYLTRKPDEILVDVTIPNQAGWVSAYWKLRRRGSFDFPVASVAVATKLNRGGEVEDLRLVLGAVASRPLDVSAAASLAKGTTLSDALVAAIADAAFPLGKPMDNTDYELTWRKKMIRPLVEYALRDVRGDDMRDTRLKITRQGLL